MKQQASLSNAVCLQRRDPVDSAPPDEEAQAVSFVIRIWKRDEQGDFECRGWVEHVQSGQRAFFLGLDQMLSIITKYVGASAQRRGRWRDCLMCWWIRVTMSFARGGEG